MEEAVANTNSEKAVRELVYRSCLLLDARNFAGFLDLCTDDFHYTISAYSPEVRKEMVWMDEGKQELKKMLDVLPRHNSDNSPLSRHATVYTVDYSNDHKQASVVSALQVFRTSLDGGVTELFGVGKLYDTISLNGATPRLASRNVRLETRMLGIGSHIPF